MNTFTNFPKKLHATRPDQKKLPSGLALLDAGIELARIHSLRNPTRQRPPSSLFLPIALNKPSETNQTEEIQNL